MRVVRLATTTIAAATAVFLLGASGAQAAASAACLTTTVTVSITGAGAPDLIVAQPTQVVVNGTAVTCAGGAAPTALAIVGDGLNNTIDLIGSQSYPVSGNLGDGADRFAARGTQPVNIDGDLGNDYLSAGPGNDAIDGGPGNDLLRGGPGNDMIDGGSDRDTATYDERTSSEPLNITLATPGGDGAIGEYDTLVGVEDITGGASSDTIAGDDGPNTILGGNGLNTLDGLGGDDLVRGGDNRDVISGGSGRDQLFGEGADDSINAFDNEIDFVSCGASIDDDAQVDAGDVIDGCEYVRRGNVPLPIDADGDGFIAGAGFDCNDTDPKINPAAEDIPGDKIDQDCDGADLPVPYVKYGLTYKFSRATQKGILVRSLSVTGLRSTARVQISCTATITRYKRRCPFTRKTVKPSPKSQRTSLLALFKHRRLGPTTTIELRITQPKANGKVRRFTVRSNAAVRVRQTLCITAPKRTAGTCPPNENY